MKNISFADIMYFLLWLIALSVVIGLIVHIIADAYPKIMDQSEVVTISAVVSAVGALLIFKNRLDKRKAKS